MIGKTWKKALAVAGAVVAVAAVMPALSEARTHYTGKTPPSIAMMATPFEPMEPAVTRHSKLLSKNHKVIKAVSKHKKHKKVTLAATKHKATSLTSKKKI